MKDLIEKIANALFPKNFTCDICGKEIFNGKNLCEECDERVIKNNKNTCPICGRRTVRAEICFECKEQAPTFDRGVSPLVYDDGTKILITKFKNDNAYLKNYFADLMCEKIKTLPDFDFIVYVPMTKKSLYDRGYNQAKLLADEIAKIMNKPVENKVLLKVKNSLEQKSLSKIQRFENLSGCFRVHERAKCKGKSILVVDDVLTTGATSETVCKLLKGAGASKIYFASIASVEYKLFKKQTKID